MTNLSSDYSSFVAGGATNIASGDYATVSGGSTNTASEFMSTVAGGGLNIASGEYATVSGGMTNTASGYMSTVAGGKSTTASENYESKFGSKYNKVLKETSVLMEELDVPEEILSEDKYNDIVSSNLSVSGE